MTSSTQFYPWQNYRCAYEYYPAPQGTDNSGLPLLLLHPIGVGLSRLFWHRFCQQWYQVGHTNPIYNPDLLGCGESDKPHVAYHSTDWAEQLHYFLQTVIKRPVILISQGAELSVALALVGKQTEPNYIRGIVLASPPAWGLITQEIPAWQQKVTWNLLDSPLGNLFYRYARRRQFLQSFSVRQLFSSEQAVDENWLEMLNEGAADAATRHAVFSFLAGFWRNDYEAAVKAIAQPTLVVVGEQTSSISRDGKSETPKQRLEYYLQHLPQGKGHQIPGRNVLPYESTAEFVAVTAEFIKQLP